MAARSTSLTESGILAAVTVVMALVAIYVPVLGIVAVLLWPLPMIILFVRHGAKWALMSVFVALVLTAVLIEPMTSVRLALSFAPTGIALGLGYRSGWSGVKVFSVGTFASIIGKGIGLYLVFLLTGIEPFSGQMSLMSEQFEQSAAMYESMGMSAEQLELARQNFETNVKLIGLLVPIIVLMMGVTDTGLNFWIGGKLLRRFGEQVPVFPSFVDWRLPPAFGYAYAFGLIGIYWGLTHDMPALYRLSLNLNTLGTIAGFLQGLCLYQAAAAHYRWPRFLSTIALFVLAFVGIFMQFLVITGILDMIFDYRKRFHLRP